MGTKWSSQIRKHTWHTKENNILTTT